MATIDNYKVKIDVEGQEAVDRLKNSLSGLGGVIAGIGFSAFIGGAMQMADAMSDLSKATGVSISNLLAFKSAMQMAGGEGKDAGKALITFFQSIDSAAQGTESAQKALQNIGISFKDVGDLSETELLNKAVKNLAEMEAGSARTAAGIALFGKSFRTIDPGTLQQVLKASNYDEAANAINKAADQVDAMQKSFTNLQIAALQALEPIIGKLGETGLSAEQAEKIIKAVAIVMGVAFGAKVVGLIVDIVGAIKALNTALKGTVVIQTTLQAMQGPKGWAAMAAGAAAAAGAVYALNKALEETPDEVKRGRPTMENDPRLIGGGDQGPARKTQFYSDAELQARKTALTTAQQMTDQIKRQNVQAEYYQQTINDTIGLLDQEANRIRVNAQLDQDAANKIIDLNKQIEIEKSKGRATNQAVIVELEKQKTEVQLHLEITKRLKQEEADRLEFLKKQNAEMGYMSQKIQDNVNLGRQQEQMNNQQLVIEGKITQQQADRFNELYRIQADYYNKGKQLQEQYVKSTSEADREIIEKKINDLKTLEKIEIEYLMRKVDQEKAMRQSSTAGAVAALEQIKRATDPFMVAQNSITTLFRSMDSALDNFVETGKLSFGDFAQSVIKDLIKIQLKAAATNFMSAGLSMLGFGIPGKAEGGPVSGNSPYIVGEQGPELFIPKMAGNIVPNNKLGSVGAGSQQPSNTYITNNISAVDAKSVAQLFAENRKTLLGSIKMAEKEMPYRMR